MTLLADRKVTQSHNDDNESMNSPTPEMFAREASTVRETRSTSNTTDEARGGVKTKRYNLVLPQELFDELQNEADKRYTTVVELMRTFLKLGLVAIQLQDKPDAHLIIREGDTEREILLL